MELSQDQKVRLEQLLTLDASRRRALQADLDQFRAIVMNRPEALRRELLGLAEERRAKLVGPAAWAMEVLTTDPDYLGPLGFTREETSNTRFLTWILGEARYSGLGDTPARAVWTLFHRKWSKFAHGSPQREANRALRHVALPAADGSAMAEVDLGAPGRIDIMWDVGSSRVLIEAKVDAMPSVGENNRYSQWLKQKGLPEGTHTQLERYRTWLQQMSNEGRSHALVLLDLATRSSENDNDAEPRVNEPRPPKVSHQAGLEQSQAIAVTWRELLRALIPVSEGRTDAHRILRAWLKSLAILENIAPVGSWSRWSVPERLHALSGAVALAAPEIDS